MVRWAPYLVWMADFWVAMPGSLALSFVMFKVDPLMLNPGTVVVDKPLMSVKGLFAMSRAKGVVGELDKPNCPRAGMVVIPVYSNVMFCAFFQLATAEILVKFGLLARSAVCTLTSVDRAEISVTLSLEM